MNLSRPHNAFPRSQDGSSLLVALSVVLIMAMVGANVLFNVSSRYNSANRSASWNEALLAAESGIDTTLAEIFRVVPNVSVSSTGGIGTGYSQPSLGLLTGLNISPAGLLSTNSSLLNITPPALVHAGEGGTVQEAAVSIQTVTMSDLLGSGGGMVTGVIGTVGGLINGKDLQLLRLRSTGTVYLTGGRTAGLSKEDNDLWRPSLVFDRLSGKKLDAPTVSRQIEVILRPVYPFEAAVTANDSFVAADTNGVFDSFNSGLVSASTGGLYDSLKRLSHGGVRANSASVNLGGKVYGDVSTNGGSVAPGSRFSGTVNNGAYTPLPLVTPPTWNADAAPSSITGSTTLPAGILLTPAQYRFNTISGNLHVTRGLLGLGTNVEIHVTGDITGTVEIDSGITAKIYVAGNVVTNASRLKNNSRLAANLQIYGVPDANDSTPQINLYADAPLYAAIYAPAHHVTFWGNNDVYGSVVADKFQIYGLLGGTVRVHFDEALAGPIGPLLRYQIAGWQEVTPRR